MSDYQDTRDYGQHCLSRLKRLKEERSSYEPHWEELRDYLAPRTGKFQVHDVADRGRKKHQKIKNSTATGAVSILVSGLTGGASSPKNPWMRWQTDDPELNESHQVKEYLETVTNLTFRAFSKSNTYRALPRYYREMVVYGPACGIVTPHPTRTIHHYPLTIGQYWLAQDAEENVNTMFREIEMTAAQMAEMFGYSRLSHSVQQALNSLNYDQAFTVYHVVEPRTKRDESKLDGPNMPWRSTYFEAGRHGTGKFNPLRESGFRKFPVLAPRWTTSGNSVYGDSPGMDALPEVKALQAMTLRKGQAVDYQTKPPLDLPPEVKAEEVNTLPGGGTENPSDRPIRPMWEVRLQLGDLQLDLDRTEQRINSRFYADLFLMLSSDPKEMTKAEVLERHEEKLMMLGPTLERVHNELLAPMAELTFTALMDRGELPPPPPELQGRELVPDFTSALAQAQQAVSAHTDDRVQAVIQSLAETHPDALDLLDVDSRVRAYSSKVGADPSILRTPEEVSQLRQARAKAQAAAAQMEAMQSQAAAAKDIAQAESTAEQAPPEDAFTGL